MTYTNEQFEKLPKWAKSEIKALENTKATLERKVREFFGEGETNTYLCEGLDKHPMTNNAQVEFRTGQRQGNRITVYVRSDGSIDVNADSRIGQDAVILPRAANAFYIKFINR